VAAMVGSNKIPHGPLRALLTNLHRIQLQILMVQRRIASSQFPELLSDGKSI